MSARNVAVWHQILSLTNIDFANRTLCGYTELTLLPLEDEISEFTLNCKQCSILSVVINAQHEASFEYYDPLLAKIDETRRDLQTYVSTQELASFSVDPDEGNGEIIVKIPDDLRPTIKKMEPFMLAVEFCLENPRDGIRFISLSSNNPSQSILCSVDHNTNYWFPCLSGYTESCTWKIEVVAGENLKVAASGNLIEVESLPSVTAMEYGLDPKKTNYKKHHYFMPNPTCAPNIGLAVGYFESESDENIAEIYYYYPDERLKELVRDSTSFINDLVEFYEDILSFRLPYNTHKFVFVPDILEDQISFASLSILNVNILHTSSIIDQAFKTRKVIAKSLAQQFFGCFLVMPNIFEWWLSAGLSSFFAGLYVRKLLGNNEYKNMIYEEMKDVCQYERDNSPLILDLNAQLASVKETLTKAELSHRHHLLGSPVYFEKMEKKAHLLVRLIHEHIGRDVMQQIVNRLLVQALNCVAIENSNNSKEIVQYDLAARAVFCLTVDSFNTNVASLTHKEIGSLLELWAYRPGVARLNFSFSFNRKKNSVEIEIKQDAVNQKGFRKYTGPITITVQELDGSFSHQILIEDNLISKFDVSCHSKGKKNKKKKIPLITGEEVDIDTSQNDSDSPVLWIRADPDLKLIREVRFEQPDHQWQNQLRYERDIVAQLDAIEALNRFPSAATRTALISVIENTDMYYKVRIQSAFALTEITNKLVHGTWSGPLLPLVNIFRKLFMVNASSNIVSYNNFTDLQLYLLQKALPVAIGKARNVHSICPSEIVRFLVDLMKYNENSKNQFSDVYYKSCLVDALSATVSPASVLIAEEDSFKSANLSNDMKLIIEEIVLRLNLEKLLPSFNYVITCSCLKALRNLQKLGHVPENIELFKEYVDYHNNVENVRMVAFEIMVEHLSVKSDPILLDYLLSFVENDPSYRVRQHILTLLCKYPLFKSNSDESVLNDENLANKLWQLLNDLNYNNSLKGGLADLYFTLYNYSKPKCLKNIGKQTLKLNNIMEVEGIEPIMENNV